jgi:hypothetical protein
VSLFSKISEVPLLCLWHPTWLLPKVMPSLGFYLYLMGPFNLKLFTWLVKSLLMICFPISTIRYASKVLSQSSHKALIYCEVLTFNSLNLPLSLKLTSLPRKREAPPLRSIVVSLDLTLSRPLQHIPLLMEHISFLLSFKWLLHSLSMAQLNLGSPHQPCHYPLDP